MLLPSELCCGAGRCSRPSGIEASNPGCVLCCAGPLGAAGLCILQQLSLSRSPSALHSHAAPCCAALLELRSQAGHAAQHCWRFAMLSCAGLCAPFSPCHCSLSWSAGAQNELRHIHSTAGAALQLRTVLCCAALCYAVLCPPSSPYHCSLNWSAGGQR